MWFVTDRAVGPQSRVASRTGVVQLEGEPNMASSHTSALQNKHAGIEAQLRAEMNRPSPDATMIQALKKKKLRIKEEIAAL